MGIERRKSPRHDVDLPCEAQILIATETFQPTPYQARLVDVSMGGARLEVKGFPEALFRKLLGGNGYVKVLIALGKPASQDTPEGRMIGKIVWMDYHSGLASLILGMTFDPADTEVSGVVRKILWLSGVPSSTS